ncbi:MAG: LssY C-terminal domain-containing protein [Pseudomonadota bacterium]
MQNLLANLDSVFGLIALAVIAFCDTLIGIGFFIFGEVAFLAAGAAYATHGLVLPALIVLVFAWLGDATSYYLGATYGQRWSIRYLRQQKRRRAWRWAKDALQSRGTSFVMLSRFLGPVAWVTPFLAGALGMPKRTFLPAAALGVLLGVGQFLFLGALGTQLLEVALPFVSDHLAVFVLAASILISSLYVWRRSSRSLLTKVTSVTVLSVVMFFGANLLYFFVLNSHPHSSIARTYLTSQCAAAHAPFTVYPGETDLHLPQPINVILISDATADDLMTDLGWYRNLTFSHDDIGFGTYVSSVLRSAPPISELYLDGTPADSAYQLPGTLREREHIRWWDTGLGVYFGAMSRTEEIAIKYYGHLPALLHDIDPKVDESRDFFASLIALQPSYAVAGYAALTEPVPDGISADYQTDGRVLIVTQGKTLLPDTLRRCLEIQ